MVKNLPTLRFCAPDKLSLSGPLSFISFHESSAKARQFSLFSFFPKLAGYFLKGTIEGGV